MVFTYSSMKRQHDAGILTIGHFVTSGMVVPPRAVNYTVSGYCSSACTQQVGVYYIQLYYIILFQFIPQDGIKIFANTLHTHVVGQ